MGVTEERQKLIDLQTEQHEEAALLEQARREFEQAVHEISTREQAINKRKAEIIATQRELERVERLEAAQEKYGLVEEGVEKLKAHFLTIAQDKPWFVGTRFGEDGEAEDPIMAFQWQGAQFGAVAKRWILGDEPGLGKTRQAVGWLDLINARKVLIVCEANICDQFAGEIMELAPHRQLFNLYNKLPAKRHAMLDTILQLDRGIVLVNFEIWRKDKDALAKLLDWELDTIIVDEAHNLKTTSTANFGYVRALVLADNICPSCDHHIKGLLQEAEGQESVPAKKKRTVPKPCEHCGWYKGQPSGKRYGNKLDTLLSTKSVKNVCFTTGTPILNSPTDLFSLLHLVNPILFETKAQFERDYLTMNYHSGKWEFRDGALGNLKPFIAGMFLARKLEDVGIELPDQHVQVIPVDLDKQAYPLQHRTIQQITELAEIQLDSGETMTIMHLIALITRKRQANVWPGGIEIRDTDKESPHYGEVIFSVGEEIDESVKLDRIQEKILQHHAEGRKQIVFSQFKTALSEFETRLRSAGLSVARFDGDTPADARLDIKAEMDRKTSTGKYDVVLANYKTGGTGLNFTAATVTHILDEEWNPGKRNQGYRRTKRIGQTEETYVYVYRIPATIDTWMSNLIAHKERIIEGFEGEMSKVDSMATDLRTAMTSGAIL
jgi:SNF2 family DNA or RNA helicase